MDNCSDDKTTDGTSYISFFFEAVGFSVESCVFYLWAALEGTILHS
jgi:hypothetical protein